MLTIIPAIDIIGGKCVRLSKGDYNQKKVYNENPLEVALSFEAHGLKRLHLVDLDGAKAQNVINWKVLEQIASRTSLEIDFGGGIKADSDLDIVFNSGATMATIGSVAVKSPGLFFKWMEAFGAEKLILGADVNNRKIAISGWLEVSDIELGDFLNNYIQKGVKKVLCTDISKDGMLQGTSHSLYNEIMQQHPGLYLIASGGVTSVDELYKLAENKIPAAIIGKAIYEGEIGLNDLQKLVLTGEFN
ncbi:MAG: 1-(5-phosphoribosyl)-5-[(5-phosphoribosylamino)methylideneamino]imidazole-4-carboxamide isomerase [Bacteroidales bacterium]|nr:1-(5-phosphoribosyl)-5-[(5-phosphoribosylamino)methylideneamino]imidazole-4-carboxamide isomerase [Bacteroidales bacterium]